MEHSAILEYSTHLWICISKTISNVFLYSLSLSPDMYTCHVNFVTKKKQHNKEVKNKTLTNMIHFSLSHTDRVCIAILSLYVSLLLLHSEPVSFHWIPKWFDVHFVRIQLDSFKRFGFYSKITPLHLLTVSWLILLKTRQTITTNYSLV